jgi:hypothetical protein
MLEGVSHINSLLQKNCCFSAGSGALYNSHRKRYLLSGPERNRTAVRQEASLCDVWRSRDRIKRLTVPTAN